MAADKRNARSVTGAPSRCRGCPMLIKLIVRFTKCYPSDRDWSNGEKCVSCEKSGLPCGPNVPFSGSALPHGSGQGSRPSPMTSILTTNSTSTARPFSLNEVVQQTPPQHRPSTAHNRETDVSPVSIGPSGGLTTASFSEAILSSPTSSVANGNAQDGSSSFERCEVLINR